MGRWGPFILQSDSDWDTVSELGYEYAVDLDCSGDWAVQPGWDKDDEAMIRMTRKEALFTLNSGRLDLAFTELAESRHGGLYELFLFSAKAMEIGAYFSDTQIAILSKRLPIASQNHTFYPEGIDQLKKALENYPNDGTPYDFNSPGLIETANSTLTEATPKEEKKDSRADTELRRDDESETDDDDSLSSTVCK